MTVPSKPKPKMKRVIVPLLYEGDTIDYSLTAEIKSPKAGNWWCKVGATTTIRHNETAVKARERLRAFVHDSLEKATNDILH